MQQVPVNMHGALNFYSTYINTTIFSIVVKHNHLGHQLQFLYMDFNIFDFYIDLTLKFKIFGRRIVSLTSTYVQVMNNIIFLIFRFQDFKRP